VTHILIAEQFVAPCARLSEVVLPLDVIAREPLDRLQIVIIAANGDRRTATLPRPNLSDRDTLRLAFAPFDSAAGDTFILGVIDSEADLDPQRIRETGADRSPIVLQCGAGNPAGDLLRDERAITVFRARAQTLRSAHWIDAYWCDAWGIYLRGWAHAYEHPVRALRLESADRSSRVTTFADRPDLLDHYPEHEHVRYGGFAVYLACPPAHPVTLVLETDGGEAIVPLELPEGPVPRWPREEDAGDTLTVLMRRFVTLANDRAGRVLQIGSRVPRGEDAVPPRDLLRGLIGLDIHPGCNVDLVGDAHMLSHFIRARSLDAILSTSVLEHIQAPWLVAVEMNRVLKMGGLIYHHVPSAWPGHAQPNDFWRFSSEGLRVLFGAASGFEIIEACDSARAAILPSPDWRSGFLDMPTIPAMGMAEILARKVAEVQPGAIAWPLSPSESAIRSHQYPLEGLRPRSQT
jgi:SAM-dependent methyltransferase